MRKLRIYTIALLMVISIFSCKVQQMNCNLSYSPFIKYVGFDSTDFSVFTIEKYKKCCGFDSLINVDTFHYSSNWVNPIADTFAFTNMYFPNGASSYAEPNYNWIIRLQNNKRIEMSDILFEENTCEYQWSKPCFCNLKSFNLKTFNCTNKIEDNGTVFIHK